METGTGWSNSEVCGVGKPSLEYRGKEEAWPGMGGVLQVGMSLSALEERWLEGKMRVRVWVTRKRL